MKRIFAMPHLAQRIFGTPLAIEPGKLSVILGAIGDRVVGCNLEGLERAGLLPADGKKAGEDSIVTVTPDGIAMIDVRGTLVHRSSWMDAASGLSSYERLSAEFEKAIADPNIKSVLLCIDSPGGEVSGCFEMAERIHAARKAKPVYAVASDTACSAAYLLGSACEKFYATEAAVTGSIGVVVAHVDVSEADKKAGVKVTHVHAGARKVDGNPHEPLSDEAKDTLQALVDKTYAVFVSRVAAYRGISPEAVKATEASVYVGADAKKVGIIDGIKSTRAVLAEMRGGMQQRSLFQAAAHTAALAALTDTMRNQTWSVSGGSGGAGVSQVITFDLSDSDRSLLARQIEAAMNGTEIPTEDESDATVAPATEPPPSGEDEMNEKELKAALEAVTKERDALKVENADLRAQAKGFELKAKNEVIERHMKAGRVTPAQRADADLLAEHLSVEDLDARLAKWAVVTHPTPSGRVDAAPQEAAVEAKPIDILNAKAKEIQAAQGIPFADAFIAACKALPTTYNAHRALNTPKR